MVNEKNEDPTKLFTAFLKARRGERHAVVLQDFPDPDAISSGLAYLRLAELYGIETELIYGGHISHQENIAMVNLLEIPLTEWGNDDIPTNHYHGSVFVDSQGTTSNLVDRLEKAGIPVLVIVDHHTVQNRFEPVFADIRPNIGACATLFTQYFADGMMPLLSSRPDHRILATALMHGIISETGSMIRARAPDFNAAAYLQPFFDNELLQEILHQQRSHRVMEVIRLSLENRRIREGFCFSGVGFLRAGDRDAIPQAADFLLTEDMVHTAVVYGIVSNGDGQEAIHGSLRTTKSALGPDTFLKSALGQKQDGSFYGGGKTDAGGFEIPLGFLSGQDKPDLAELKWKAFNTKILRQFFAKIGVEDTGP